MSATHKTASIECSRLSGYLKVFVWPHFLAVIISAILLFQFSLKYKLDKFGLLKLRIECSELWVKGHDWPRGLNALDLLRTLGTPTEVVYIGQGVDTADSALWGRSVGSWRLTVCYCCSVAGQRIVEVDGFIPYCASKHAVAVISSQLRGELARLSSTIRVTVSYSHLQSSSLVRWISHSLQYFILLTGTNGEGGGYLTFNSNYSREITEN